MPLLTPPRNPTRVRKPTSYGWAWKDLVFAFIGDWSPTHRDPGTLYNGADFVVDPVYGKVLETGSSDGGIYFRRDNVDSMVGDHQTMLVLAKLSTTTDQYANLLKVPYRNNGTWTDPYNSLSFHRFVTTTQGAFTIVRDSDSSDFGVESASGFLEYADGEWHQYVIARFGDTGYWYKDGEYFGSSTNAAMIGGIDWNVDGNGKAPIHIGQRNHLVSAEGHVGFFAQALIYNRGLEPREIAALWRDPFAPFRSSQFLPLKGLTVAKNSSLYATGDQGAVSVVNEGNTSSPLWSSIDDDPAAPSDSDWINNVPS